MTSPTPSAYTEIAYSVREDLKVAIISLNRPETVNAISRLMTRELDLAFNRACADDCVNVIYLRGEGNHFSSGHDLGSDIQIGDSSFPQEIDVRPRGEYLKWYVTDVEAALRWRRLRKPIVCGLKGYAIFHATVVACCADVVLASPDLKYMPSLVEANLFPWAASGAGAQKIKEIMFTQRFVLANEAMNLGIVNRVVPANDLDSECLKLAALIGNGDAYHVWMMKKMANGMQDVQGLESHVRSSLDTWTAFRKDWERTNPTLMTKDTGGSTKRLAPVKSSLQGEAWRQSLIANKL
eukprot:m.148589 g.148589  ORF g.148589 m.148589 type:complete len:295 (-) comp30608_c0_seq2:61-945(-)